METTHRIRRGGANFGSLRFKTEGEQQIWNECSRLIANCIIYYNATLLSRLLELREQSGDTDQANRIGRVSPIAWQHINFYGRFEFLGNPTPLDIEGFVHKLAQQSVGLDERWIEPF